MRVASRRTDRKGSSLLKVFAFSSIIQILYRQLSHCMLCFLSLNYTEIHEKNLQCIMNI